MPIHLSPIALTMGVLILALMCFIAEWLPVDITAICVTVVLMILGLVTPDEGIAGFSNSATITVMAMFILSEGISRTGVILIVRDFLVKWGGNNPNQQIFVMGAIIGPITAFLNNTAVVAVFLPIIEDWCRKRNISVSKLLIPLSYVTVLGGMITLIGTSTNIVASGVAKDLGFKGFGLFQFTALGIITFIVGLIYLSLFAPRLLPDRKPSGGNLVSQEYGLKDYVSEIIIKPRSSLIGQTLRSSEIQRKFDLDVLEIIRDDSHFPQPIADKILAAGDILLVRGGRSDLLKIRDERGINILPDVQFSQKGSAEEQMTSQEEGVAEVLILSNSNIIGSTLKDLRFRQRYNTTVLAIRRGEELVRDRMGKIPLRFGDLLLVQGPKESLLGLQTSSDLLVMEQQNVESMRKNKAWIAIAILFLVILIAAFDWMDILVTSLAGVIVMILTGCLKPGEIYNAVRWDVIFLLAGLFPLGTAMKNSGTTEWLATNLVAIGGNFDGFWLLVFFYLATNLLTELLSNSAAVILMIPIAVKVATTLSLNPFAFMFVVTFAASNSYLTPIGYQTNTMVYGPGGYKFLDFTRVGLPLNLILSILTPLLIVWLYGL
ncbi:SLC13 family permease [Limnofasciculus baicalensis]|uniref:SLC13 family permease n=1 Tax=Limnofasciculus baicalensis BBK-W-15 TaxID=2699891 RepID=A0AAE3GQJ1_9CYAN|nr:SLC13 family permease [Limnofasciculus baicalensis]MCP2728689.1 SLC13 family permease [Limnofasciculus baicalensis BBK-W-15]